VAAFARLARPTFLAGSFVSVGLGTAIAAFTFHGIVDWQMWLAAQLTVTSAQLMTHFANEYFDRHADRYTAPTAFSGGSGVLVGGFLGPRVALRTALVWAMLTFVGIAWLDVSGQQTAAWLAIAIAILAWTYSAPPIRLLARGLGEIETALIVAVLAPLCAASAQGLHPNAMLAIATLPGAAAMFTMMLAVEVPDREADALGGKRNIVVRVGRRRDRGDLRRRRIHGRERRATRGRDPLVHHGPYCARTRCRLLARRVQFVRGSGRSGARRRVLLPRRLHGAARLHRPAPVAALLNPLPEKSPAQSAIQVAQ
jgi:1,4-dihydroxy-2-naphthoate octaprenyltransferase